jgi:hypothetical protein
MGIPKSQMQPKAQKLMMTANLYERREVELSFQSAALAGATDESVYWLLELCESGWIDGAWDQLWLAYYDFYASKNPQMEGELMELADMRHPKGTRDQCPLLHGASALIGRERSAGAWLLRHGAIARAAHNKQEGVGVGVDWEEVLELLLAGPVKAAEGLATLVGADWEQATPLYTLLVTQAGCNPGGACGAWGRAGSSPLAIICALLVHLEVYWAGAGVDSDADADLDLSPIIANQKLVVDAMELSRLSRLVPARDKLLMRRQYSIRPNIGCFGLPRHQLPPGPYSEHVWEHWLQWTAGCKPWDRAVTKCKGVRGEDGVVEWRNDNAEDDFYSQYGPDVDEQPIKVTEAASPMLPQCKKLRWLMRLWPVKPRPDLWRELLRE